MIRFNQNFKKKFPLFLILIFLMISSIYLYSCSLTNDKNKAEITYTVTVKNGQGSGPYIIGSQVNVIPDELEGKTFTGWKVDDTIVSTTRDYNFIIDKDITITAVYEDILYFNVTTNQTASINNDVEGLGKFLSESDVTVKAKIYNYKTFLYWKIEDEIVSYNNIYIFKITKDTEIIPIYDIFSIGLIFEYNEVNDSYILTSYEKTNYIPDEIIIPEHYNDSVHGVKTVTEICDEVFNSVDEELKTIIIPNTVIKIGKYALSSQSLESVILPVDLISIGDNCFDSCNKIISINIPSKVESIGMDAFRSCSSLENIIVEDSNTIYSDINGVLFDKQALKLIKYPNGKKEASYIIPNTVLSLEKNSFSGWFYNKSLSFAEGTAIKQIDSFSFYKAYGFDSIMIPSSINTICNNAFYITDITDVIFEIGSSLKTIGNYAFYECSEMENLTLPNGLQTIGDNAFEYCSNLKDAKIPNTVISIGKNAFKNCSSLYTFKVAAGVTFIDENAFTGCSKLVLVFIDSEEIALSLTASDVYGGLIANATNIYIFESCATSDYINNNYIYDKTNLNYKIYTKGTN